MESRPIAIIQNAKPGSTVDWLMFVAQNDMVVKKAVDFTFVVSIKLVVGRDVGSVGITSHHIKLNQITQHGLNTK